MELGGTQCDFAVQPHGPPETTPFVIAVILFHASGSNEYAATATPFPAMRTASDAQPISLPSCMTVAELLRSAERAHFACRASGFIAMERLKASKATSRRHCELWGLIVNDKS